MFLKKLINILLACAILIQCQILMVQAYSQVASNVSGEGPKIYKALNLDLIFPKSFNSSENVISTTAAGPVITSAALSSKSAVINGDIQQQHQLTYNALPQSNEQTNRDAVDAGNADIADDGGGDKQPVYVTPSPPNEDALYKGAHISNHNGINNGNSALVLTENPINIQQQQEQQKQFVNDMPNNNNNYKTLKEQQQNTATGRAVDYRTGYPFGQLITPLIKNAPRPVYTNSQGKSRPAASLNVGKTKVVYPQARYQQKPQNQAEIDKYRGRAPFKDRFTPSEAVASHQLKSANHNHQHQHHHHNHAPTYTEAASSNVVNSYVPPKNLYSFPPNNADYPLPGQDNKYAQANSIVNSYSPPPSGPLKDVKYPLATASSNDNGYKYAGPLSLSYLPSINDGNDNGDTKDSMDNMDGNGNDNVNSHGNGSDNGADADDGDDSIGVLPASILDGNDNSNMMNSMNTMDMNSADQSKDMPHDDHQYDTEKEYPTPPPEWLKAHPEAAHEQPPHDHDTEHKDAPEEPEHDVVLDHDHDHDHDHHHHHPDIILDHDTSSYPFYHSVPSFPVYHNYPEIIYDDHHDHHHVEPPPPTTTEAPPPEPPPEPRVKKYSYFYIGRKLWYIPLYFTVWFSFYVLWLILKSIARHKVNLPNHYVARRSVDNYNPSKRQQEIINQLTITVMDKIENFKRLFLSILLATTIGDIKKQQSLQWL